jgi:hypothetical protein
LIAWNDHVQNLTYNLYLTNVYPKVTAVALKSTFFWQILKPPMTSTNQTADVSDFSADLIGIDEQRQRQIGPHSRCCIGAGTSIALYEDSFPLLSNPLRQTKT